MKTLHDPTQASSTMSFMHRMESRMKKMMQPTKEERIHRPPTKHKKLSPDEEDLMLRNAARKHGNGMAWCDAAVGTGFTGDSIRRKCLHKGYAKKNKSRSSRDQDNVENELCRKVERFRGNGMKLDAALKRAGLKNHAYYNALARLGISKKVKGGRGRAR